MGHLKETLLPQRSALTLNMLTVKSEGRMKYVTVPMYITWTNIIHKEFHFN